MDPTTPGKQTRLHVLERQVIRLERRLEKLNRLSERYAKSRLVIALIGGFISLASFEFIGNVWGWILTGLFVALFSSIVYYHNRIKNSLTRHKIWLEVKTTQIARIQLDWERIPSALFIPPRSDHPFEIDLDITGEHSLHQLMDIATSREGSQRLRNWLLATTPDPELIQKRQDLVKELSSLSLFRDKLFLYTALASKDSYGKWEGTCLLEWLQRPASSKSLKLTLFILGILAAANISILILTSLALIPKFWRVTYFIYFGILFIKQKESKDAFRDVLSLESTLNKLKAIFQHLEAYRYGNRPNLARLCEPFRDPQKRPSLQLKQITRIASALSLRSNPLIWFLFNATVPWDVYFVYRLNQCKTALAELLPVWLDILFELEALNSLANFAYLNPNYVFPEVMWDKDLQAYAEPVQGDHRVFRAEELGHPLIPDHQVVRNDFALNEGNKIIIITGSNMAGKSSFLRTLGMNLCLAYAGGPVHARSFQTSLFRIFTCMRVNDSVTDGFSYFYAEVKRLKALLSAIEKDSFPVFFLIDEIFKGTNNRERLIGSRAYIRALTKQTGIGAIATHDLELVKLADEIPEIVNYHFREEVKEGRMIFDYKLRPGPCPTTNALKIMEMEGLPVE